MVSPLDTQNMVASLDSANSAQVYLLSSCSLPQLTITILSLTTSQSQVLIPQALSLDNVSLLQTPSAFHLEPHGNSLPLNSAKLQILED